MRLGMSRLQQLLTYGFNETEGRVYLALLEQPSMGASALAKTAGVPRTHLYEVLQGLQNSGLVEVVLSGAVRDYRARPLHEYVERRIREQRATVEEMEARLDQVKATFRPMAPSAVTDDPGTVRLVLTRRAVAREIDRMIDEARVHLTIVSSEHGGDRVLRHLEAAPLGRGVVYEVYLPRHARAGGLHQRLPDEIQRAIRWHDLTLPALAVVRDEREALWVHPTPDDGHLRAGKDTGLLGTSSAIVASWLTLLRAAGAMGAPAELEQEAFATP